MLDRGLDLVDRAMTRDHRLDPSEWVVVTKALATALSESDEATAVGILDAFVMASTLQDTSESNSALRLSALDTLDATAEEVLPRIYRLDFTSQQAMCKLFLRFQEHYESPKFHHRRFGLPEFKRWYAGENGGNFSYYEDWGGFNIPSWVFDAFRAGEFDPLDPKEQAMLDLFAESPEPFYVIGTAGPAALEHEMGHGLFTTNANYRREILRVLSPLDVTPLREVLLRKGYTEHVVMDEIHAYFVEGGDLFIEKGVDMQPYLSSIKEVQSIFEKYKNRGEKRLKIEAGEWG